MSRKRQSMARERRSGGPRRSRGESVQQLRLPRESRLIEGWNPVLEALRAGRKLQQVWLAAEQHKSAPLLMDLAQSNGVRVTVVERQQLSNLTGGEEHQGVAAAAPPFEYSTVEAMLAQAEAKGEAPFLLILDHIEDPQNLGSLIRTAECAGVHGVVIPNRRAASVTAAVGKASAGAIEHMLVARVGNLVQEMERLKEHGLWIVGAHMEGERSMFEADMKGPIALVIGAEGRGLSRLVAERCDGLVHIPMWGRLNSLNASVAGALLMYEVARSRSRKM